MRRAAPIALLVLLCAACKTGPSDTGRSPEPTTRKDQPTEPQKEAPPMTDLDPKSPAAWMQAQAVAATAGRGKLEKRSDALPFLFKAEDPPWVLVHQGKVVRDKGAQAAGAYLRDLGIVEGKGPAIDDVLVVLAALDAMPPVTEVPKDSYVNAPGDKALSDITARIYANGDLARITLVYFLSGPLTPERGGPAGSGDTVGGMDPNYKPKPYRKIARCKLVIPKTGDAAWKVEHLNWTQE
ncbi:MAG TPA: hypothetical protein VNO30_17740 [Kofleriaceae bacterium]|nr:hypothetical protein [Kofleriaceae bacterium]